jgi:non-ribosomal peptide synthetase component F
MSEANFLGKNDAIRLHFSEENGAVKQHINQYRREKIDYFDFSSAQNPETEFDSWALALIKRPFQLIKNSLYYIAMFKISEFDTGFLVKFHHIIADGWSINIASEQIYSIYHKLLHADQIINEPENSYIEFINNEQRYLNSERFLKNRAFWLEKFKDLPEPIFTNNSVRITGKRITNELENGISRQIKEFAANNKYSLNTLFITLFLIYLHKISRHNDIVIGTPVLNRSGYDNLFQTCVNYYNTRLDNEVNGLTIENQELYNGNQFYALQLVIKDWGQHGNLTIELDYKASEFTEAQINRMYHSLLYLVEQILNDPHQIISKLNVLPESEKITQIYEFNATESFYPQTKTIQLLFEARVEKNPGKAAISFENISLTYGELNKRANQLARVLRNKGVTRDTIVGLMVTHSPEAVIGILGILKAGGAYVPIDPDYPSDRKEYMLTDSGCRILLTNCPDKNETGFGGEIISLNSDTLYSGEDTNLAPVNTPNDLAYVIYTSGSTGKPKGVMIEHQGLVNYIWWAKKVYVKDEDDSFAFYSSLSFDLTVTSIFTPLIGGNKMDPAYRPSSGC